MIPSTTCTTDGDTRPSLPFPLLSGGHLSLAGAQRPASTCANRYPAATPTSTSSRSAGRQACRYSSLLTFQLALRLIRNSPVASHSGTDPPTTQALPRRTPMATILRSWTHVAYPGWTAAASWASARASGNRDDLMFAAARFANVRCLFGTSSEISNARSKQEMASRYFPILEYEMPASNG